MANKVGRFFVTPNAYVAYQRRISLPPASPSAKIDSELPAHSTSTHPDTRTERGAASAKPGLVVVLGYTSTVFRSRKVDFLRSLAEKHGLPFLAYDHRGHGLSSMTLPASSSNSNNDFFGNMGPNANVKAQEVEVEEIDYHESLARVNPVVPDPRLTIGDWAQDLIKILSPPAPPSPSPSSTSSTPPTPPTPASTALPTLLPSSSFPVIIVAASMGVWVSLLAAKHLPHRVAGIIGIGGSMSFPSRILGSLADEERKRLDHLLDLYHWELETEKDGAYSDPSPQIPVINRPTTYHDHHPSTQIPYSYQMLRDSQSPSVSIHKDFSVRIPIHLIHGLDDTDVPWSDSVEIAECVASRDVKVTLLKGGDHRLSREEDLECLARAVEDMIERVSLAGGVG